MKIDGINVNLDNLDPETLIDAVERQMYGLDNPGFCLVCGHEQEGCEPDARKYVCEACGEAAVYGAQEIFMTMGPL